MTRFKDKVAVIAGAEHPMGASLVRRLAGFGAKVVAIGTDEAQLRALAQHSPARIEPLAINMGQRDVLHLLQEAWAEEPLDIYVDLFPLCEAMSLAQTRDVFSRSAALAAAFAPGIRQGRASAVLAYPQGDGRPAPNRGTRAAGYAALVRHFAQQVDPGRFLGIEMRDEGCSWTGSECLSAGDCVLVLCHPVSRGLQSGSVVQWHP
ncbi:hypothetical protein [Tropicibacter oceani]|uniref:SDR family NAD(P)-dependent oxidoreductase n=1 Tax=Tropicibacter oceani TaxID=3058420 RepID=A0ABY8QDN5_9RHOB|nr:hypothetical protein [Tropicibacter oceani]WGW02744.1 hypothetical protein QF118_12435 [Tropicibacter oceani]